MNSYYWSFTLEGRVKHPQKIGNCLQNTQQYFSLNQRVEGNAVLAFSLDSGASRQPSADGNFALSNVNINSGDG